MGRIQGILSHPDFEKYLKLNEKQEVDREFCCHQLQHALDVARIYYILCLEAERKNALFELQEMSMEKIKELVYGIALLHDIGRWRQYLDHNLDHAEESAILAKPILKDCDFSTYEIEIVLKAIRAHRDSHAHGLGKILYRADKLSRDCKHCQARDKCHRLNSMETRENILY